MDISSVLGLNAKLSSLIFRVSGPVGVSKNTRLGVMTEKPVGVPCGVGHMVTGVRGSDEDDVGDWDVGCATLRGFCGG